MKNIVYRPEIDGIRALAVISVIIYHAKINILSSPILSGGFIGVDIFFVISGYLITSIILTDLQNHNFSILNFYERRIRRLLPTLLFILLVFLPLAWIYYLPIDLKHFAKISRASILFFSNFAIWESGMQYAAKSSLLEPFLHTWSLSIEEQFYILVPFILIFVFRFLKSSILILFLLGFIMSLAVAIYGSFYHPVANFFMLPTRGWELLGGSILAKLEIDYGRKNSKFLSKIMPSVGIIFVFYSLLFFNEEVRNPGLITLIPILGIMIFIWYANNDDLITSLFSNKIFVGIGLISYSLYLWHYPIFAFARYLQIYDGTISIFIIFFILIFLLSLFSYYLIEKPFRNKFVVPIKQLLIYVLLMGTVIFTINSIIFYNKEGWFPKRFADFSEDAFTEPWSIVKQDDRLCYDRNKINSCTFNDNGTLPLVVIGDSQLSTISESMVDLAFRENFKLTTNNFTECVFVIGFDQYATNAIRKRPCNKEFQNLRLNLAIKDKNSVVILGGQFPVYLSGYHYNSQKDIGVKGNTKWSSRMVSSDNEKFGKNLKEGFVNTINKLLDNNISVILVYPLPELGWNPLRSYQNYKNDFVSFTSEEEILTINYDDFKIRSKESFELLDSIESDNIYRVYPHKLFCNTKFNGKCITEDEKKLYYFDDDHLSLEGSKLLTDLIHIEIKKILEIRNLN